MKSMERNDFINSREQVIDNVRTLYRYLSGIEGNDYQQWAVEKLVHGRNFVVEIIDSKVCFAPSRFVGYLHNTRKKNEHNPGNGTQTDYCIKKFYNKVSDDRLDEVFGQELEKYEMSAGPKKYWIPVDMTIEDILESSGIRIRRYWLGRVSSDKYFEQAIEKNYWLTQQRYGHQKSTAVSNLLDSVLEVKEGDVILLAFGKQICAYGYVKKCPFETDQISNLADIIQTNQYDYDEGLVKFDDTDVFYEDLTEGCDAWGERIMVDSWHCYNEDSYVDTSGMSSEIRKGVSMMSLIGINASFAKEKINQLKDQYAEKNMFVKKVSQLLQAKRNIILQGAPGTGKTYNTAAIALSVLGVNDVDFNDHQAVMERYGILQNDRIFFTTFHQSLDYEDFVEGLKPQIQKDDKGNAIGVTYEPQDGIFKRACQAVEDNKERDIVDCIDKYIESIKGYENRKVIPTVTGKSSLYVWWKEGNKTISSRSVLSASTQEDEYSPSPLNIEKVKLQAVGDGRENNWPAYAEAFINAVKKEYPVKEEKSVVLIIDEINRGNVSKIFGELITLLEADKRTHGNHPISVMLPYSKTSLTVPDSLYIIGTMNTTDRSTGTLDYALRRRFAFVTLKSDVNVINDYYGQLGDDELREVAVDLFNDIFKFIQDPRHLCGDLSIDDLMVGHSYFMAPSEEELSNKIEYEVVPLIAEYINDGILDVTSEEKQRAFEAWLNLQPIEDTEDVEDIEEV